LLEERVMTDEVIRKIDKIFKLESLDQYILDEKAIEYLPPIRRPSKVLALGRNYAEHAKEEGEEVPQEPIVFNKLVTSLVGHKANIVFPRWLTTRIDYEVELAVIIGKKAKYVKDKNAYDYILGYTILNDITAREMQRVDLKNSYPWMRSKSIDTFCPIGPWIIPKQFIPEPHQLDISLSVNGQIRQKSRTAHLIFSIPQTIEYITKYFTLLPGDIIATGTPEGIGAIKAGDTVEATISNIGTLVNQVVREQ